MPTDSTQQTNLQLLVGATPGQVVITCSMSDIVANELDKYGKVFANNQTLVGNCGTGDQTTVFAVGNGLFYGNESSPSTERHNAFEVKYNGDVIIDGDILDNNGNKKVLSKASDGCYYLSDNIKIGGYSGEVLQIDGSNTFNVSATTKMILAGGTNGISLLSATNKDVVKIMPMASSPMTTADLVSIDCGGGKISNVATPVADTDAATKKYVDDTVPTKVSQLENDEKYIKNTGTDIDEERRVVKIGDSGLYDLALEAYEVHINSESSGYVAIMNLRDPASDRDAATKKYVDDTVTSAITTALNTAV